MTNETAPPERKLLFKRHLAKRWRKDRTTIYRMGRAGKLPRPDAVINGEPAWYEDTIERAERESVETAGLADPASSSAPPPAVA
jgi:predicted DNA-binding transcriptional regulator AlpA